MTTKSGPIEKTIEKLSIDTIRTLSMDAVQKANSGHPGTPMALAPAMYVLWTRHLRFHPRKPDWADRDRFVLSNGHASMLLYSMLHLTGFELSLEELKNFRQWASLTPGHPERGHIPGVEVTTGPLGQGIANAVGLALGEQMLGARFNRPGHTIVDHYTMGFCGDGDLMEGVSQEACSLAGHLRLGKLIFLYDDNKITIAGSTQLAFTEDVEGRFQSLGWHTLRVEDANDLEAIDRAISDGKAERERPTLILVRSHIGYGSPNKQDTKEAHGEPLGEDEVRLTKAHYGWPEDAHFLVPEEVRQHLGRSVERGAELVRSWTDRLDAYRRDFPAEAAEFERRLASRLPEGWESELSGFGEDGKPEATRDSSAKAIQKIAAVVPELIGGSADLDPSTKTFIKASANFQADRRDGRNLQYGVREHGMGAILNGMAAHGGLRPFGATFFIFSDYMRPTLRLAALSKLPTIFVYTHDSIGLGEDGPTHQAIEQLASLRAVPDFAVIRPADARETAEAWRAALERNNLPTALVLTRQKLPQLDRSRGGAGIKEGVLRGGYVLRETAEGKADLTLLASGSEVSAAIDAAGLLEKEGISARVVSLASWELFEQQEASYRDRVLGRADGIRLSIEAGASLGWDRYVNPRGASVSIDRFGASAPGEVNMEKFGFSPPSIADRAKQLLASARRT